MAYVDGFLLPVPKRKIEAYRKISSKAGKVWREHGALDYKECVGDDLRSMMGPSFKKAVRAKAGETVVFAYIVYKSGASRSRQQEGHEGPAHRGADESEVHALRREAHAHGWFQGLRRRVGGQPLPCTEEET
jgi:uncharacterized protein YbaA (DUF1428 family)